MQTKGDRDVVARGEAKKCGADGPLRRTTPAFAGPPGARAFLPKRPEREKPTGQPNRHELGPAQRLRENEERFRLLVEQVRDYAIFLLDPGGYVVSWNAGAEQIKGYKAEEIIGRHFSQFYPREDVERGKPAVELAVAVRTGRCEDEGWRIRKNGTRYWANVVITALRNDAGVLRGFAKVTRDLTERKRAEDALRESEARWQAFLDHSSSVIFVKDSAGRYTHLNRRFESVFGLARELVLGRTDQGIFPSFQAAAFRANDLKVLAQGVPLQFEEVAKYSDGLHTSVVEKFPLRDAEGRVYAIGGIATDITALKRAEEAWRKTQETLQTIFDAAPVAILGVDRAGRVTSWNKGAHRMFGWSVDEVVGRVCPTIPANGLEDYQAMIQRVLRQGPETGMVRYRQKRAAS